MGAGAIKNFDRACCEINPLDAPAAIVFRLHHRADMAVFPVPFEAAIVGKIAFAVRSQRGAVRPAAGARDDAFCSIGGDPGQVAGSDLDDQHRAIAERHRPFGKLQPLGERAELHRDDLSDQLGDQLVTGGAISGQYHS